METQTIRWTVVVLLLAFRLYDVLFGSFAKNPNTSPPASGSRALNQETRRAILRKLIRGNQSLQQIADEVHIPVSELRQFLGVELHLEEKEFRRS